MDAAPSGSSPRGRTSAARPPHRARSASLRRRTPAVPRPSPGRPPRPPRPRSAVRSAAGRRCRTGCRASPARSSGRRFRGAAGTRTPCLRKPERACPQGIRHGGLATRGEAGRAACGPAWDPRMRGSTGGACTARPLAHAPTEKTCHMWHVSGPIVDRWDRRSANMCGPACWRMRQQAHQSLPRHAPPQHPRAHAHQRRSAPAPRALAV